jgi:hypothetical protein
VEPQCTDETPWDEHWHACSDDVLIVLGPIVDMRRKGEHPTIRQLQGVTAGWHNCHAYALAWHHADVLAENGWSAGKLRVVVTEMALQRLLS